MPCFREKPFLLKKFQKVLQNKCIFSDYMSPEENVEFLLLARLEPIPMPTSPCQSFDAKETLCYFKLQPRIADIVVDVFLFHDISNSHPLPQTALSTRYMPQSIPVFLTTSPSPSSHPPRHELDLHTPTPHQTSSPFTMLQELLKLQISSKPFPT